MGVMSRRVLPYCAAFFCFSCPSLRPSSRKPTKRYKTFLRNVYEKAILSARTLITSCSERGRSNAESRVSWLKNEWRCVSVFQDGSINERTLSKMSDYACHNLDKLIIILAKLETNAISDLKTGDQRRLSSTIKIYTKLLASCNEHMWDAWKYYAGCETIFPFFIYTEIILVVSRYVLAPSVLTLVVEFLDTSSTDVHALAFSLFGQFVFSQVNDLLSQ